MKAKNIKVIFDTNIWISFLIGKRLAYIKNYIADGQIIIVVTQQTPGRNKRGYKQGKNKKIFSAR